MHIWSNFTAKGRKFLIELLRDLEEKRSSLREDQKQLKEGFKWWLSLVLVSLKLNKKREEDRLQMLIKPTILMLKKMIPLVLLMKIGMSIEVLLKMVFLKMKKMISRHWMNLKSKSQILIQSLQIWFITQASSRQLRIIK